MVKHKKITKQECYDTVQNIIVSYYLKWGIYEIKLKGEELFEMYNIALEKEEKRHIDKKEFYELIKDLKDKSLFTFYNRDDNKHKIYIYVAFKNNYYNFQLYDNEVMDDYIFGNFTKEQYRNDILFLVDPYRCFEEVDNLNMNQEFLEQAYKNINDFTMIRCTDKEIVYSIKLSFDDVLSDFSSVENRLVNPKKLIKYINEDLNTVMSFSWKNLVNKIKIVINETKDKSKYIFLISAVK